MSDTQIETHLSKSNGFFAGGDEPTSADYMMVFCLEAWGSTDKSFLGPKTRAYVNRAHERFVALPEDPDSRYSSSSFSQACIQACKFASDHGAKCVR